MELRCGLVVEIAVGEKEEESGRGGRGKASLCGRGSAEGTAGSQNAGNRNLGLGVFGQPGNLRF